MNNTYIEDYVLLENRITQETIDNLKRPVFSLIDNTDVTDYIFAFCKQLLSFAKERHESKEMAYAINLTTLDFVGSAFGNSKTIDITPLIRLMDNKSYVFIVLHNHPSNSPFSPKDLNTFFSTSNMMILVVLGNKGTIYVIEKGTIISEDDYRKIKKLIIKYRQSKMDFEEIISQLSDYDVVYNSF